MLETMAIDARSDIQRYVHLDSHFLRSSRCDRLFFFLRWQGQSLRN